MNNMKKMGSVRMAILLSILLALSGMAAIASADIICPPNRFSGNVTLNGVPAPVGTVIEAYIDGDFRGTTTVEVAGVYKRLPVNGDSPDDGKTITFTVCGLTADQTDTTWVAMIDHVRMLNLSAEDAEAPVVTNPDANPPSIVADGAQLSRLNVTVKDNCAVGIVTVNLSAIGGSDAQVMECIGGDVYSTTTNASVGTANGTYDLQVNASDIAGNYNDCVDIVLEIVPKVPVLCGDTNGDGKVDMDELFDAVDAYIAEPTDMDTLFCVIDAYIDTA